MDVFSDYTKWQYFNMLPAKPTWQQFELGSNNLTTYEILFLTDWDEWNTITPKFKSYCLFRHFYKKDGLYQVVDEATKIYLTPNPYLIELPIPVQLKAQPELLRVPGFRYQTFSRSAMKIPEVVIPWSMSLRALF